MNTRSKVATTQLILSKELWCVIVIKVAHMNLLKLFVKMLPSATSAYKETVVSRAKISTSS